VALFQEQKPPISAVIENLPFYIITKIGRLTTHTFTSFPDKKAVQKENWVLRFAPNDTSNAYPAYS
jgi:hypothetical protein